MANTAARKFYIGIDPGGSSGGLALLNYFGAVQIARKMPATDRDILLLLSEMSEVAGANPIAGPNVFALIERVHAMRGQGVSSTFAFGRNVGALHMALTGSGIPYEDITPQRWQLLMGCRSKGDKNVTKARAQQLFPGVTVTHAIADALLIAECARRLDTRITPSTSSTKGAKR